MSAVPDNFDFKELSKGAKSDAIKNIDYKSLNIAESPVTKPRRCTDLICCIIFTVVFVGMFVASIFGYIAGQPWKLVAPIDGDNNICGWTEGYEEYSHLMIGDIDKAVNVNVFSYGICVKECPLEASDVVECKVTEKVTACDSGSDYGTYEFMSYCLPVYDTLPAEVQTKFDAIQSSISGSSFGELFADIMICKWVILASIAVCCAVTFIYVYLMHHCSFWLSWISVGLIQLMLVGIGFFAFSYRRDQIDMNESYADESAATWLKWLTWISWIMAGIYYIVILCNFQSLRVAVAVIQTASSFVADSKRLLLVPILYFFMTLICSIMFIAGLVCVASIGEIEAGSALTQTKTIKWSSATEWMYWGMIFGFFWVVAFIMAMNEFVVIVSSITWYYSDKEKPDDDNIPGDSDVSIGMWWSIRYHAGTLAAGSFLLALVWMIRTVFEYLSKKMEDATGNNGCTKCLVGCIRCCLECFDRFVRYINRNAYIYCALSGESFCSSALNSCLLMLKNWAKFGFVDGIADCFMFIAKFFIGVLTTLISFFLIKAMVKVSSVYAPLLVVFIFSYIVAGIFIGIFDCSANTILQCYLLDQEVLAEVDHIPRSLRKFFDDKSVQDALNKNKGDETREHLVDDAPQANNMA